MHQVYLFNLLKFFVAFTQLLHAYKLYNGNKVKSIAVGKAV